MSRDRARRRSRPRKRGKGLVLAEVDAEPVKQHWNAREVDEKFGILRFEEPALVNRVYEIQQSLFLSDFKCYLIGFRGQDTVREKLGLNSFDVEGVIQDDGDLHPVAFFAKRAFCERTDFFELMEERLGRRFLQSTPPSRSDWVSFFDVSPSSWSDFMCQVFHLVEAAVFQSQLDSVCKPEETPSVLPAVSIPDVKSNKKKKVKKKRSTPVSISVGNGCHAFQGDVPSKEDRSDIPSDIGVSPTQNTMQWDDFVEEDGFGLSSHCNGTAGVDGHMMVSSDTNGRELKYMVEHDIEGRTNTGWWRHNGLSGNAAEWHWIDLNFDGTNESDILNSALPNSRAIINKTFVDVVQEFVAPRILRTHSQP